MGIAELTTRDLFRAAHPEVAPVITTKGGYTAIVVHVAQPRASLAVAALVRGAEALLVAGWRVPLVDN